MDIRAQPQPILPPKHIDSWRAKRMPGSPVVLCAVSELVVQERFGLMWVWLGVGDQLIARFAFGLPTSCIAQVGRLMDHMMPREYFRTGSQASPEGWDAPPPPAPNDPRWAIAAEDYLSALYDSRHRPHPKLVLPDP